MKKFYKHISFPFVTGITIIIFVILVEKQSISPVILFSVFGIMVILFAIFILITKKACLFSCVITVSVLLIIVFYNMTSFHKDAVSVNGYINEDMEVTGYISEFPSYKNDSVEFEFMIMGIKKKGETVFSKISSFRVLIKIRTEEMNFLRGNMLLVKSKILLAKDDINGFDYRKYLFYKKIFGVIKAVPENIRFVENGNITSCYDGFMAKYIWPIRDRLCDKMRKNLSPANHALLLSIFFGIRSEISEDVYREFQNSGMLHLLAISGMNISFIGGIFLFGFRLFLSKTKSYVLSFILLFLYISTVYYSASSTRAFVMYSIFAFYFISGNKTMSFTILSLSALIMMIANPFCIFDIGFQLSFFATAGIILFSRLIEEALPAGMYPRIKSMISVTLSAYLSVIVLQMSLFGRIQVFSIISSLFIVPFFELLFVYWFFMLIIFYFIDIKLISMFLEVPSGLFLKIIHLLNNLTPVELPEIPYFMQFIIFPVLYMFFYHFIPFLALQYQKIKKSFLIIDFGKK